MTSAYNLSNKRIMMVSGFPKVELILALLKVRETSFFTSIPTDILFFFLLLQVRTLNHVPELHPPQCHHVTEGASLGVQPPPHQSQETAHFALYVTINAVM